MDPLAVLQRYYTPGTPLYQVLVDHSRQVTDRALAIGRRLGADLEFIEEAGMLHDIGIFLVKAPGIHCHGDEPYLRHGVLGRELLEPEFPRHALVCERHVGTGLYPELIERQGLPLPPRDMRPQSLEEEILCYADKFYSKGSGGELDLQTVRDRLSKHGQQGLGQFDSWQSRFEPELGRAPASS